MSTEKKPNNKHQTGTSSISIEAFDFQQPNEQQAFDVDTDNKFVNKANRSQVSSKWWHSQFNMMLVSFGLLGLAAIMFVLLAPPPELNVAGSAQLDPTTQSLPDSEAPWNQNQLAEARSSSQEILSNLLDSKKKLESMGVSEWAPDRFESALQEAALGDDYYKKQEFKQALETYQSAVTNLESLFDVLPELVASKLAAGSNAIEQGKSELAAQLYTQVIQLEPSNIAAANGLERAEKLDEVMALLATAKTSIAEFEEANEIDKLIEAEKGLIEAKSIDDKFVRVEVALTDVKQRINERRFKLAMTKAYQALFTNRYSAARAGFAEALRLKPEDRSAQLAQQQALASDKTSSLSSLLQRASQHESNEQWTSALNNYRAVLQRDPNQIVAKMGVIRAGARQELDTKLLEVLADPLAISRKSVKASAQALLTDAQALVQRGDRLQQQITELESALSQSEANLKISLLSNQATEVTLQKVGSKRIVLGKFTKKNLVLKPGRYVVKGERLGYRDVRTEINLVPNISTTTFSVSCDSPIKSSSNG